MQVAQLTIQMAADVARLRTDMDKAQRTVSNATASMTRAATVARNALGSLAVGFAGIQVSRSLIQASDAITLLSNKLKLASRDAKEASQAYDGLFQIAQRSRVSFTDLGNTYAAIARNTKQLGVSQSELFTVTESIANAMTVTGGSAESMKAALVQLGQGFASGTLRGEELNSVMEQTPRLAQAIAEGMGITIGQLREMGQAGLITSKAVVDALKSQSEVLKNEVGVSAVTVGQAMTVLNNSTQDFIGVLNQTTGASSAATSAIVGFANVIKSTSDFVKRYSLELQIMAAIFIAPALIAGLLKVVAAMVALRVAILAITAAMVANPIGLGLLLIAAAAGPAIAAFSRYRQASKDLADQQEATNESLAETNRLLRQQKVGTDATSQKEAYLKFLQENRTAEQKMQDEIAETKKALGSLYSPEIEKMIRDKYIKPTKDATEAQRKLKEFQEHIAEFENAHHAYNKNRNDEKLDQIEAQKKTADELVKNLDFETKLLGMGNEERERAVFLRELENKGIVEGTEEYQKLIQLRESFESKNKEVENSEKQKKAIEEQKKAYEDLWKSVDREAENIFIDIAQNGEDAFKRIGQSIERYLLQMLYEMTVKQWIIQVSGVPGAGGAGGNILSSLGSSALGGMNIGGASLGAIGSSVGTGFTTTMMGGSVSGASAAYGSAGMGGVSAGLNVGAAGAYGAGALGGMAANRRFSGGYSLDNKHSQAIQDAGVLIATAVGGPLAGVLTGVGQSVVNRAFGRKTTQSGIEGTFSNGQIDSSAYQFQKGGLFRSDKTTRSQLDDPERQAMNAQLKNVQDSAAGMARALGLSDDAIKNFTGSVKINLMGLNEEEAAKKMAEEMEKLNVEMLAAVPGINMTKEQLKDLIRQVPEMIAAAGISVEGMADIIKAGMMGRMSEAQVGEALADMVIGGIYDTMISPFATQIAEMFNSQILTPMFTAIAAGVPISQAISQASIDAVVQKAQQAAEAINVIMSDPGFKAAIDSIQSAIGGIAKASTSTTLAVRRSSQASAQAAADAARRAKEERKRAAEAIRQEWQGISDALIGEIRRIRGELVKEDSRGMGYLQSQFALATAQARSGDQEAAKMLPELSRAILEMAQTNVATLADLQRLQGQTASSLVQTNAILAKKYNLDVPQFAVGTNYVPNDMLAMVHEGEAIVPKAYNPAANGSDELMKVLISEVTNLRAEVRAGVTHSAKTAKILERVTPDGNSLAVSEAA